MMRIQFASLESIASLMVVLLVLLFSTYCIKSFSASSSKAREIMSSGFASYDFMSQLARNSSESECIFLHGPEYPSCGIKTQEYRDIYGLRLFEVVPFGNASSGPYQTRCFTYNAVSGTGYICIEAV